jgi:ketosteroid isomerase-like protein
MAVLSTQTVADELEIRQLTAAYSDAVTARDYDTFAALWAPGGRWVIPGLADTVGGESSAEQLRGLLAGQEFLLQLLQGGQVWVDGDTARARWTVVEQGRTTEGQGIHMVGVYQDELARTEDGWRFASRHFEFLYRGFADVPGKAYPYPALDA